MKTHYYLKVSLIFLTTLISLKGISQDMFRVGVGLSLKDSTKFVNTFSFDFNRTESVKEKLGKSLLYNSNGIYLTPSVDVNLGEGTKTSENNVLAQLSLGKTYFGNLHNNGLKQHQFNTALEFSPSYNADKSFEEVLYYGQISYKLNVIGSRFTGNDAEKDYVKKGYLIAFSPLINIGSRMSKGFDSTSFYMTTGISCEMKFRFLAMNKKNEPVESWVFKVSATSYWIISEMQEIYDKDIAGKVKASIDKRILDKLYANISYKFGNDGPIYKDFHAIELGLKFKW